MSNTVILTQNILLFTSLQDYYDKTGNINKIITIITGQNKISLRVIEWFVTNYSKKNNITFQRKGDTFNVWSDYKSQLKGWSKKLFDPFCRKERLNFNYKDTSGNPSQVLTTIGQLNFFRWMLENKILDYVKKNIEPIEKDMITNCKYSKNENGERRKRRELSICATRTVHKQNVKIVLSFD